MWFLQPYYKIASVLTYPKQSATVTLTLQSEIKIISYMNVQSQSNWFVQVFCVCVQTHVLLCTLVLFCTLVLLCTHVLFCTLVLLCTHVLFCTLVIPFIVKSHSQCEKQQLQSLAFRAVKLKLHLVHSTSILQH